MLSLSPKQNNFIAGETSMLKTQTTPLETRLHMYRKVLAEEFIREFNFLVDVIGGRAQIKGDFTDKIVDTIKSGASALIGVAPIPVPVVKEVLNMAIGMGMDWLNGERKGAKLAAIDAAQRDMDQEPLRILMAMVAFEASYRYEFVIATKLSEIPTEAIIPFAKAGVERMLDYIARNRLPLQADHLLTGLILGRSGAYVSGFFNTRLTGKDNKVTYTAEGIYSRSAFRTPDGKYWVARKAASVNVKPLLQDFIDLIPAQVKGFVKKTGNANTGPKPLTVKFDKTTKTDPKYGYVLMQPKLVNYFYGQTKEEQTLTKMSAGLQQLIKSNASSFRIVSRADITGYLKSDKKTSFLAYLKKLGYGDVTCASYEPDDAKELDLTAFNCQSADFSGCILNGVILSGNLSDCKFHNAYLFAADVTKVTAANKTSFQGAHCECLKASGANFAYADFTGAHCHFADFTKTDLSHIQTLGAQWIGAKFSGVKTEDKQSQQNLQNDQKQQQDAITVQVKKMQQFEIELHSHQESLADLQKRVSRLETELDKPTAQQDQEKRRQALQMQKLLADLMQEKQTREVFTRYCQAELQALQEKAQVTENKVNFHDEQIHQMQEQLKHSKGPTPMQPIMAEFDTLLARLERTDVKQQQTDQAVQKLTNRVTQHMQQQQAVVEEMFSALTHMQKEMVQFKTAVGQALEKQSDKLNNVDNRLALMELRLQQSTQVITDNERQDIFKQQLASMFSMLTAAQLTQPAPKPPIDERYIIPSTQLSFNQKLADGSFGKVYLGRWAEQNVAIKMIEKQLSEVEQKEFIREVNIMSRLRHLHIVQFYGACLDRVVLALRWNIWNEVHCTTYSTKVR